MKKRDIVGNAVIRSTYCGKNHNKAESQRESKKVTRGGGHWGKEPRYRRITTGKRFIVESSFARVLKTDMHTIAVKMGWGETA